jgi:outer membrane receptor protein involved in Fe transport
VDGIDDIALNAPRHKGSASVRYRTADGFSAELRGRHVTRFDVKSGVFEGTVDPYTIVDVNVDYPLPFLSRAKVTATALNLLDNRHREIVGAPQIGRMVYLRVTHAF